jgi:hypothetical protein
VVENCITKGGVAAIIYGADTQRLCDPWSGTLVSEACNTRKSWPPVVTVTRAQGIALLQLLQGVAPTTVTVTIPAKQPPYG